MINVCKEATEDQEAEVDNKSKAEVRVTMCTMLMINIMMIHMIHIADIRLIFFHKSLNGLVAVDFSSEFKPQVQDMCNNHPMSFIPKIDTRRYVQNSYLPRTVDQWNRLPASVSMSTSLDTFKEGVSGLTHH